MPQLSGYPTEDTYLDALNPTTNYDAANPLSINGEVAFPSEEARVGLDFDISSLPGSAIVTAASILVRRVAAVGADTDCWCKRITQYGFDSATATWNKANGLLDWATAGGDYTETGAVTWVYPQLSLTSLITGLADQVQAALADGNGRYVCILGTNAISLVGSIRATSSLPGVRPLLTVDYILPGGGPDNTGGMQSPNGNLTMKRTIKKGSTSRSIPIFVEDGTAADGSGLDGLSQNVVCYYVREFDTGPTAISITYGASPLGTFDAGDLQEIDATNMPGWYNLCLPDAVIADGVADYVAISLQGGDDGGGNSMKPVNVELQLVDRDVFHLDPGDHRGRSN